MRLWHIENIKLKLIYFIIINVWRQELLLGILVNFINNVR